MKKFIAILVLSLLWCNTSFADTEKIKLVCLFDEYPTKSIIVDIDSNEVFLDGVKADYADVAENQITAIKGYGYEVTEYSPYVHWVIIINRYTGVIGFQQKIFKEETFEGKCKKNIEKLF